jgi:CHASE1-domain containing sensor protein
VKRGTKVGVGIVVGLALGIYTLTAMLAPRMHEQWGPAVAFLFVSLVFWGMFEEQRYESRRRRLQEHYGLSEEEAALEIKRADRYERLHGPVVSEFRDFLDDVSPEDFERFEASR